MAYVISVCGAGGKTTYCFELANFFLKQNKKTAIITTTRMRDTVDVSSYDEINNVNADKYYIFGEVRDKHIFPVSNDIYKKICEKFDIVIIEADGSRCMPVKIPKIIKEPVIKENTNEIVLVYSPFSYGRYLKDVCFRYDEHKTDEFFKVNNINDNTIVNEEIIIKLYKEYYINHIYKTLDNFKDAKIIYSDTIEDYNVDEKNHIIRFYKPNVYKHSNVKNYKNIDFTILSAGLSKRYEGKNKLDLLISNTPLYEIMIKKIIKVREDLIKNIFDLTKEEINVFITIVTNKNYFDKILNVVSKFKNDINITIIKNENPEDGLSSSIKLSVNKNIDKDAICFFNSDMPLLKEIDIVNMIKYTILSDKSSGAMYNENFSNPAIFYKKYYNDIINISGDKGPRDLLNENVADMYMYHIDENSLIDIDTEDNYKKVLELYG